MVSEIKVKRINEDASKDWWEVDISELMGIHTLPNPVHDRRSNDPNYRDQLLTAPLLHYISEEVGDGDQQEGLDQHIQWLMCQLGIHGYDCRYPIDIIQHSNSYFIVVGGHHRALAMYLLGQETIPARETVTYEEFLGMAKDSDMYKPHLDSIREPELRVSEWSHLDHRE